MDFRPAHGDLEGIISGPREREALERERKRQLDGCPGRISCRISGFQVPSHGHELTSFIVNEHDLDVVPSQFGYVHLDHQDDGEGGVHHWKPRAVDHIPACAVDIELAVAYGRGIGQQRRGHPHVVHCTTCLGLGSTTLSLMPKTPSRSTWATGLISTSICRPMAPDDT